MIHHENVKHELVKIEQHVKERQNLLDDFNTIQMGRPPEVLRRFVVGAQAIDHPAQGWAQCVLEMSIKYDNIRRAKIQAEILELEIAELEAKGDARSLLDVQLKRIDQEAHERAMLGAIREFYSLYDIYQEYGKRYSREELNESQKEYWFNRLTRQAQQDQMSRVYGVSAGNIQGLREAGIHPGDVPTLPEPQGHAFLAETQHKALPPATNITDIIAIEDRFRSIPSEDELLKAAKSLPPAPHAVTMQTLPDAVKSVQERYLETGKQRMLIVTLVASPEQPTSVPVLEREYRIPTTVERRFHCVYGMTIDRGYTEAVFTALRDDATHIMFIEDDTFPPLDAIERLLAHNLDIVGGWYPKRQEGPIVGVPIVIENGIRTTLDVPTGALQEVYTIPMGCTLVKTDVFKTLEMPWFVTTAQLSQDSFFSQKARDAGYTLWCDTSIRCQHIDRETGKIYE